MGEEDYVGLRHQYLPRVPIAGETLEVAGYRATAESVGWLDDGRVMVVLAGVVEAGYLDQLREAGWQVFPRRDADDWLRGLTEGRDL